MRFNRTRATMCYIGGGAHQTQAGVEGSTCYVLCRWGDGGRVYGHALLQRAVGGACDCVVCSNRSAAHACKHEYMAALKVLYGMALASTPHALPCAVQCGVGCSVVLGAVWCRTSVMGV